MHAVEFLDVQFTYMPLVGAGRRRVIHWSWPLSPSPGGGGDPGVYSQRFRSVFSESPLDVCQFVQKSQTYTQDANLLSTSVSLHIKVNIY